MVLLQYDIGVSKRILITNDDGVDSPGLWALVRACSKHDCKITVAAPRENQSAAGASLTLRKEIEWESVKNPPVANIQTWTVGGRPGDAAIVGLDHLSESTDILISGIIQGANIGFDLSISGTVGAALQGYFRGITSLAISYAMTPQTEVDWETAEHIASIICGKVLSEEIPKKSFLNINIPLVAIGEIAGLVVTRAEETGYFQLEDAKNNTSKLKRKTPEDPKPIPQAGTDLWALSQKYVSICPIQINLTDYRKMDALGKILNENWKEKEI